MSTYTIDDTLTKIIYDIGEREIYNDIRAELGVQTTEEVVDSNPIYSWKLWVKSSRLPIPSFTTFTYFTATLEDPIEWKLDSDYDAYYYDTPESYVPYYDFTISLVATNDPNCKAVKITNTGDKNGGIHYTVRYKYLKTSIVTHEETSYDTLTVRSVDVTSIKKYGRRVMNLAWPEGASEVEMKGVADSYLARHKDAVPVLSASMLGDTDAKATQIFTREISDVISVVCANLGMASTDFFLDSISMNDTPAKIPSCVWQLTGQRDSERTGYFLIDTDLIDGDRLIAGSVRWFKIDTDRLDGWKLIT